MNNVCIIGRLVKEVELRKKENLSVGKFTLAVSRDFKNANGEYEADFIDCVAFNKTSELIAERYKKGDLIGLTGRIQKRSYDAQDGTKRYVTEVVANKVSFLPTKPNNETSVEEVKEDDFGSYGASVKTSDIEILESDYPF